MDLLLKPTILLIIIGFLIILISLGLKEISYKEFKIIPHNQDNPSWLRYLIILLGILLLVVGSVFSIFNISPGLFGAPSPTEIVWPARHLPRTKGEIYGIGVRADLNTPAGYINYGPYITLPPGDYEAFWIIRLDGRNGSPDSRVVDIDVVYSPCENDSRAQNTSEFKTLKLSDWDKIGEKTFTIKFSVDNMIKDNCFEFRSMFHGKHSIKLLKVGVKRI